MTTKSSDAIVFSNPDRRFNGPAYNYLRASDQLPSYDQLTDDDPLCKVKLFSPTGRFTFYVAAATSYEDIETPVLTGYCISPLGPDCDEYGDQDIGSVIGSFGFPALPLERDIHWQPQRLSEIQERYKRTGL